MKHVNRGRVEEATSFVTKKLNGMLIVFYFLCRGCNFKQPHIRCANLGRQKYFNPISQPFME